MLSELIELNQKNSACKALVSSLGASRNYVDCMLAMTETQWSNYRLFQDSSAPESGLLGLSPEGNFNLYMSRSLMPVTEQVQFLKDHSTKKPELLFALSSFNSADLNNFGLAHLGEGRKISHFEFPGPNFEDSESLHFREATTQEIGSVQVIAKKFNEDQSASWSIPEKADLGNSVRFFLLSDSDGTVGCFSSELKSDSSFWFNRFFVLPQYRRSGAAASLWRNLVRVASSEGKVPRFMVWDDNTRAIKFYRKMGCVEFGSTFLHY